MKSVKELSASPGLTTIPRNYAYFTDPIQTVDSHPYDSIPLIDFSLLASSCPDERSKIIQELGRACRDWGFFMVVNHGVEEGLMKGMIDKCKEFFDLTEEEKREYQDKHVLDPIRYGTSFNTSSEKVHFWRDFLKVMVHPHFYSPNVPPGFRDIASEYCKQVRQVVRELLRGISLSLGLDALDIEQLMNLGSGLQILIANLYPPCPNPEVAIGMPPHSDHGLLTVLTQNEIGGLEIEHDGRWFPVHALPNSFLVNTGDHLEIFSNGRYKSVMHRAMVNNKATRISLAIANDPSLNAMVIPAPTLVESEKKDPAYEGMVFKEYLQLQQGNRLNGKSCLDYVRAP